MKYSITINIRYLNRSTDRKQVQVEASTAQNAVHQARSEFLKNDFDQSLMGSFSLSDVMPVADADAKDEPKASSKSTKKASNKKVSNSKTASQPKKVTVDVDLAKVNSSSTS